MLIKDKYCPVFLEDFIINKYNANRCLKLISKSYIPHILVYGPEGCGKYTFTKSIINSLYKTKIDTVKKILKINGKEIDIKCSNYHFEILIDKYSSNKTLIYDIIDYLTDTKDINSSCIIKIIIIRNINYCSNDIFSYLKNKIETSSSNFRFFTISNNISGLPKTFTGLLTYIQLNYESKNIIEKFLKDNKIVSKKIYKQLDSNRNLNYLFTLCELSNVAVTKTFTDLKEKQIINLIKDSINNPDNIIKIRELLYEINIKNIKLDIILKNILYFLLKNKEIDNSKKYKFCELFAKYDHRSKISYKSQIHYESLFSQIIFCYHS